MSERPCVGVNSQAAGEQPLYRDRDVLVDDHVGGDGSGVQQPWAATQRVTIDVRRQV